MAVLDEAKALRDYVTGLRRDLHRHPELGWQETRTQGIICQQLGAMGIPYEKVCGTGVIATLRGAQDGPAVGLRADMDALPITEQGTDSGYCSETPGVMHACGHDCHVAMLLGAARILKAHENELRGTVTLIFQPAEEVIEGAHAMCGLPQLAGLSRIFAAHVWIDLPTGAFSIEEGPRMASADNIELRVTGKSAHGASPHKGTDAIVAACGVVGALQTVVSRLNDPLEPVVVTIGTIEGGTSSNIIADEVRMTGTVRSFSPAVRDRTERLLEQVAGTAAQAYGAGCKFTYRRCTPATINEPASTAVARRAAVGLFGEGALSHLEKTTGGEDFAWFLERIPGCYVFVGARNEQAGKCWPHHHGCFDIDEEALTGGTALLAQLGIDAGKDME